MQCDLQNVTYVVKYTFSAGLQKVETTKTPVTLERFRTINLAYGFKPKQDFRNFISPEPAGASLPAPADCQGLWNASSGTNTTCAFDASVLDDFSYQTAIDAFTSLVRGSLSADLKSSQPASQPGTSVGDTVLGRSTELRPIIERARR